MNTRMNGIVRGDSKSNNMNILFICTANVSRSFMAEKLLKHEIEQLRLDHVFVSSAGIFAFPGSPPDPKIVEYLMELEISTGLHEARQMTQEDMEWADIIFVMEKAHRMRIENVWPSASEKIELLGRCVSADFEADDITDPFGRSRYHYRSAKAQITLAIKNMVKVILASQTGNGEMGEDILKRLRGE